VKSLALVIALSASAGCDGVLGLTKVIPPVDGAPDAAGACVDPRPFGPTCRTLMPTLLGDTALRSMSPDLAFGAKDAVQVNATDPALFKFDLTDVMPGERIAHAHLVVPFVSATGTATACSANGIGCAPCGASTYETAQLYWLTSDWSQSFATYTNADQNVPWTAAGASGSERSELVTTGPPPTTGIDIDVAEADMMKVKPECFVTSPALSLLVLVEGSVWIRQLGPQPCVGQKSATLELTVCSE
jgi:hypothetical protein